VLLAAVGRPVAVDHFDSRTALRPERWALPGSGGHHRMTFANGPTVRPGTAPDHVFAAHGQEISLLNRPGSPDDVVQPST
jgi:hypothetical protein